MITPRQQHRCDCY